MEVDTIGSGRPVTIQELLARAEGLRHGMAAYVLVMRVCRPGEQDGEEGACSVWTHALLMDMVAAARAGDLKTATLLPQIRNNADYTDEWRGAGVVAGVVLQVWGPEARAYSIRSRQASIVKLGPGVSVVDPAAVLCKVYTRLTVAARALADTYFATVGGILAAYEMDGCVALVDGKG
jgi:hypothetical protein